MAAGDFSTIGYIKALPIDITTILSHRCAPRGIPYN
jgi:hypothetical protein